MNEQQIITYSDKKKKKIQHTARYLKFVFENISVMFFKPDCSQNDI